MNINQYAQHILDNGLYKQTSFMKRLFGIVHNSNKWLEIRDKELYVDNNKLEFGEIGKPLVRTNQPVTVTIYGKKYDTTIGLAIANILLMDACSEDGKTKLDYINEEFTIGQVMDNTIAPSLGKKFTIDDYKRAVRVSVYIRTIANYIVEPVTPNTVDKPKGMDEFKAKLVKAYDKRDKDWRTKDSVVAEFTAECMAYMNEVFANEPNMGITLSGKFTSSIRKRFVIVGTNNTPDPDGKAKTITTSLFDGLQLDKHDIAASFNDTRDGSASRGIKTRDGGVTYKTVTEATHSTTIEHTDCGSKEYKVIKVNKHNFSGLISSFTPAPNSIEITEEYLRGKEYVKIRTPMGCKLKGERRCIKCCGTSLGSTRGGIGLTAIKVGSLGMLASLAKFHITDIKLMTINMSNLFRRAKN